MMTTTDSADDRHEEHLTAEEDDGSAELQPEDGGTAPAPEQPATDSKD